VEIFRGRKWWIFGWCLDCELEVSLEGGGMGGLGVELFSWNDTDRTLFSFLILYDTTEGEREPDRRGMKGLEVG